MSKILSDRTRSSLEATARELCIKLGGHWSGAKGMACCPAHDDRTPSLGVTIGRSAILFHCFAGCAQSEVLAALARTGVNQCDLFNGNSQAFSQRVQIEPRPHRAALRIWRESTDISGTQAKAYLEARAILASSPMLRFHAQTPLGPKGAVRFLPALIAATSLDEGVVAVHRTFLHDKLPCKASFEKPKRALGRLGESAVRLFQPINGRLGLAEGIESALSASALTGIPCWATLGNERFGKVTVPESVTELYLFVDADKGGELAAKRGLSIYSREDRCIHIRKPSSPGTDWNDELVNWTARHNI
ncbi:toprim domain-containing protein [Parasphingorhabdus sp. JC815]|uniref:DUF7146 domain-containing protein n=1 Tax=Parasphingorhabdus sp. JC815 TaxID=3232140 RepID=UPI0034577A5F